MHELNCIWCRLVVSSRCWNYPRLPFHLNRTEVSDMFLPYTLLLLPVTSVHQAELWTLKNTMDKDTGGEGGGHGAGGGGGESKLPRREGSGGSSGTSGIGSGAVSETSSNSSDQVRQQPPAASLLSLFDRGEWHVLEQRLRHLEKGSPVLSHGDPEVGTWQTPMMMWSICNDVPTGCPCLID